MSWRLVVIAVAAVGAVAALAWLLLSGGPPPVPPDDLVEAPDLPTPTPAPEQRIILLFAAPDGLLHPELREVPLPTELEARVRVVLAELAAGPGGHAAPTDGEPVPEQVEDTEVGDQEAQPTPTATPTPTPEPTPHPEGLVSAVPFPLVVRGVFVDRYGQAFVDLAPPPGPLDGSHTELLLAYAVVNSILLNCPELGAVQLLFGGEEVDTLTGHLDLSRPLTLNKRFIAAS
jgi:hypothetical protein